MSFDLGDYENVHDRRGRFFEAFPEGSIQVSAPEYVTRPDGATFVRVEARAYRTKMDQRPGIDWTEEPMPGRTPYTKGSEVENASTSAIGRAILCVLPPLPGSTSGASRQEVAARHGADQAEADAMLTAEYELAERVQVVMRQLKKATDDEKQAVKDWAAGRSMSERALHDDPAWLRQVEDYLDETGVGRGK